MNNTKIELASTFIPFHDGGWVERSKYSFGLNRVIGHSCTTVAVIALLVTAIAMASFDQDKRAEGFLKLSLVGGVCAALVIAAESRMSELILSTLCINHLKEKKFPHDEAVRYAVNSCPEKLIESIPFIERPRILIKRTRNERSPLELLETTSQYHLGLLIRNGANPHFRPRNGHSDFQKAMERRQFALLTGYSKAVMTPSHEMVRLMRQCTDLEVLRHLIKQCRFNPNAVDRDGNTVLKHWVNDPTVSREAFQLLIQLGATTEKVKRVLDTSV